MQRVLKTGWVVFLALWALASCASSYPAQDPGGKVRGTLFYDGALLSTMNRPSACVYAFARLPPAGPPHGALLIDQPQFPVTYELSSLEPWSYFVVAQLVDFLPDTRSDKTTPRCLASGLPAVNPVRIRADASVEDIDLTLKDADGSDASCSGY